MLNLLKSTARSVMPQSYQRFRKRYQRDARLTRAVIRRQGLKVAAGPFAGMWYIENSHGSRFVPKLLGSYECELHEVIAHILSRRPSVVVDVGCAEGYYAVGFARALPQTIVYAYDIDYDSRQMCAQLATLNDLSDRVIIQGKCDHRELQSLPLENAVIICDCEGYELELLNPEKVPKLNHTSLLVELHDTFVPGLTGELLSRFQKSHHINLIDIQPREPDEYDALKGLPPALKALALYERDTNTNPPQQWAYLTPKK